MRSLRVLTALLVALVLVPAGVLGWLGIRGTDRYEAEMRQRVAQQMERVRDVAAAEAGMFSSEETLDADARVEGAAGWLARRLPFESPGLALAEVRRLLRVSAPGSPGTGAEFDRVWQSATVDIRVLDATSRPVLPARFDPDAIGTATNDVDRLFAGLERDAYAAAFGQGDVPSALATWRSAASRLSEPVWRGRAEIEAALLEQTLGHRRDDSDTPVTQLEQQFSQDVLARTGRPWALLLLRDAPRSPIARARLRRLDEQGLLAQTPLTDAERARAVAFLASASAGIGEASDRGDSRDRGHDVHRATLPAGLVLEVSRRWSSRADGPAGALLERWRLRLRDVANVEFMVPGEIHTRDPFTAVLPIPGDVAVFRHRDEASMVAEVDRSRRLTTVGVVSLIGVIGLGIVVLRLALVREREARRLKDDFLANVSHELRTPLTSVCLHADLLAESTLSDERRRAHADVVRAEGARLSSLVDDLLDFAALERGSRRLEPEPIDLVAAAERALAPFRVLAAREHVLLALDGEGTEVVALADPHAVARILANLVGNAWKHGRPSRDGGPGRIELRVAESEGRCVADVIDDGPGVPHDEQPRLFQRFVRGAGARDTRGVGLGLALSRDLARALGGDLVVVEDPARTVFRLTLPAAPPLPTPSESPS